MSEQNGFGSGFILGSIIGGVVGGILGTVLSTRNEKQFEKQFANPKNSRLANGKEAPLATEESIELARHGLEDKIAQLNLAIDDVRQQLGSVQANSLEQD